MFLPISKLDEEQQIVWGWASLAQHSDGRYLVDRQGDVFTAAELEKAAYNYVLTSRDGGEMHHTMGVATLVESFVVTPEKLAKMGLPEGSLPTAWWVGFKIHETDVWARVKKGEFTGFSIGGSGKRTKVNVPRSSVTKHRSPVHPGTGTTQAVHGGAGSTERTLARATRTRQGNLEQRIAEASKGLGRDKLPRKVADVRDFTGDPRESVPGYKAETERINRVLDHYISQGMDTESLWNRRPDGTWDLDRAKQHEEILSEMFADAVGHGVKADAKLLVAAGLGGAGKTTTITKDAKGDRVMGVDLDEYLVINADDIKETLVKKGMVPHYPGLSPMETAALIHEESSHIAKLALQRAQATGLNVVFDGTFGSSGAVKKVNWFRDGAGPQYEVTAMFVRSRIEDSVSRAAARHLRGRTSEHGGRYVPFSFIEAQHTSTGRLSRNEDLFEDFKTTADRWYTWENGRLIASSAGDVSKASSKKEPVSMRKLTEGEVQQWAKKIRKIRRKPTKMGFTAEEYWDAEVGGFVDDAADDLAKAYAQQRIDPESYFAVLAAVQKVEKSQPAASDVHQAVDNSMKKKRKKQMLERIKGADDQDED